MRVLRPVHGMIDDLMSMCPHCGFLLGAFVPGMPCPSCGEPLL